MNLLDFVPETISKLKVQLTADQTRWGDTWRHRPIEGQEDRAFARFNDYYDQYKHGGIPIPWIKIIGEAHIAMVRSDHPEELKGEI